MKKINLLLLLVVVLGLGSCLDSKDKTKYSETTTITSFYLKSEDYTSLKNYKFIVDEDKGVIYNTDSIDFSILLDSVAPVISPNFIKVIYNGEVELSNSSTEIYLNFNKFVSVEVFAKNGDSKKYWISANRHQVDPDTFIWSNPVAQLFDGQASSQKAVALGSDLLYFANINSTPKLFHSQDGTQWSEIETNLPADIDFTKLVTDGKKLYYATATQLYVGDATGSFTTTSASCDYTFEYAAFSLDGKLYGIAKEVENQRLVVLENDQWLDVTLLPDDFPVSGASIFTAKAVSGKERVFVVGGIDKNNNYLCSVYSTENGAYWSNLTAGKEAFTPRADAAAVQYASMLMLYGGVDSEGHIVKDAQLISRDYGMTWYAPTEDKDSKILIPAKWQPRSAASAIVSEEGYLYIIGGQRDNQTMSDVFRALNYASIPGFIR